MPEPIVMKLSTCITPLEPISPSVSLSIYVSPIVARQRLGKNIAEATNTHATKDELLGAFFLYAVGVVSRKVGN
jgi:hypothetical protein